MQSNGSNTEKKTVQDFNCCELKKEEQCTEFWEDLRRGLGAREDLSDDWGKFSSSAKKVFGVSSGQSKEDKETWLWNEGVQESVQRKRLTENKWDRQDV